MIRCDRSFPSLTLTGLAVAFVLSAISVPAGATVPGENGQIAFVRDNDILVMERDGSGQRNLTDHPAADHSPDWSPDGRSIAFVSDRSGLTAIHVMNADGTGVRMVGPGTSPSWSPDGRWFAFIDGGSVWVMDAQGSDRRRLTNPLADTRRSPGGDRVTGLRDVTPIWSPDGSRIGFTRHYDYPLAVIFTIDPSGGSLTAIRDFDFQSVGDWSPDGLRLVGTWHGPQQGGSMDQHLQIIEVDGTDESLRLVSKPVGAMAGPGWSPDGERLVSLFYSGALAPAHIVTLGVDGSDLTDLTDQSVDGYAPDWQALNPYPVGLVDSSTGIWHLRSESAAVTSFYYGDPGDYPILGDWDGDGVDTPGLFRQSDGFVYLRNSNSQGIADIRFFFGNPGDIPLAGDFDGDGLDTVSIYRPSEGRVYVINRLGSGDTGLGAADTAYYFGDIGDKPFVGDFDADGVDTIGLHRESTGLMYFRNDHAQGPAEWTFLYGDPGDRVITFDWDGDGSDSVAVFRPSNSKLYIRFTNTPGSADREYFSGEGDWLPVTGTFSLP